MAHFLNKKYKTKISDKDYDIIATGRKYSFGKKNKNGFGASAKDYIEMNIFNPNGALLESIKIRDINDYVDASGKIKINPGVLMRRNGYFSGDYEIEINFLREVAGSSDSVLLDENNEIYTGEFDVALDGRIFERGAIPKKELREVDYKFYIHEISNGRKEIRLTTLPIKDKEYKKEFTALTEQQGILFSNSDEEFVEFKNPANENDNVFTFISDDVKLNKNMVGGEFVVSDAFEIINLENLDDTNDGFNITIGGKGFNQHYGPKDSAFINRGDQEASDNIIFTDTFNELAIDSTKEENEDLFDIALEVKQGSGLKLFDGAFMMGFRTAARVGFPYKIITTITDLDKIKHLEPEMDVTLKGVDLVNGNTFESKSNQVFTGNETKGTIPIPTNHKRFGGLYSAEFNISYNLNGVKRGFRIFKRNLFVVIPDFNVSEGSENLRFAEQFVRQGVNY
tara:strand:- start:2214 stop:3572 length:1359 start_codon:yes stop_codon:yes gene_type:complete